MGNWYKIKDKLHLTLFWYTIKCIHKIEKQSNDYKRMLILYRLILKVHKTINPEPITKLEIDINEIKRESNWETILNDLEYYSDRWGWSRVNRIILMYNKMNNSEYCFIKPKLNPYNKNI